MFHTHSQTVSGRFLLRDSSRDQSRIPLGYSCSSRRTFPSCVLFSNPYNFTSCVAAVVAANHITKVKAKWKLVIVVPLYVCIWHCFSMVVWHIHYVSWVVSSWMLCFLPCSFFKSLQCKDVNTCTKDCPCVSHLLRFFLQWDGRSSQFESASTPGQFR